MKKTLVLTFALILVLLLVACGGATPTPTSESTTETTTETASDPTPEPTPEPSKEKTFGDLIEFDDLEIVFGNDIVWTEVSNQFSDKDGMEVFLVPMTVKNIKDETHGLNMFYYSQYGTNGTNLDSVGTFFDNEISLAGNLRPGATQEVYMAFLYDGDGDYYVEFSTMFGDTIEVKLPIVWGDNSASPLSENSVTLLPSVSESQSSASFTLGDTFEFDDLKITFRNEIEWTNVSNQFSDKDGMDVFLVPMTIENMKNETHGLNMFYYTRFGSQGTKLDDVGTFFDGEVGLVGDMRSGAIQETFMAFLYDGDGDYHVEFSTMFGDVVDVVLPIIK